MKTARWLIACIFVILFVWADYRYSPTIFVSWFSALAFACFITLGRIAIGPSASDRAAGLKILGIQMAGFCALLAIATGRDLYLDIALAWVFQAFVGTLVLAKFIEGRRLDD